MPLPTSVEWLSVTPSPWDVVARAALVNMFGVVGATTETETRIVVRGETSTVEMYRASHSFRWYVGDLDRGQSAPIPTTLSGPAAALCAENFLDSLQWDTTVWGSIRRHELSGLESRVPTVVAVVPLDGGVAPPPVTVAHHIIYSLSIDGIPLTSPGGRLRARIEGDGRVTEVTFFAHIPTQVAMRSADIDEVSRQLARVRRQMEASPRIKATVAMNSLRYFSASAHRRQSTLFPVFEVRGASTEDGTPFVRYYRAYSVDQDTAEPWIKDFADHITPL